MGVAAAPAHCIDFDGSSARPAPFRGIGAEVYRWLSQAWLRLGGWTMHGDWPDLPKMVLIAAPHTSNWDGINMLAATGYYRIRLRWMGKASLTAGPFGGLVRWAGCVPIDRSRSNDVVAAMCEAFAATDAMVLAVPPEGTRSLTRAWKSGFYHIAVGAGVPLVFSVLDYGTRRIHVAGSMMPTGDYDADMLLISRYYATARGKHSGKFIGAGGGVTD
ncbi:MAG: 1-acyl-sn-glycerol-3-phosphate acyltransferase [Polymorphobacter sp.]